MVNVAVIGTGYIGPVHIEALRRISGVAVKGVTDANPELARKTAEKYNIEKVYRDYREILADPSIHVMHTCAPNSLHFPMNKAAIERGKHILSEKPLAMTLAEAEELTELAEKKGIVTGINFCYRYYPVVLEMALRVRRGDAGNVRMATGHVVPGLAVGGDRLHVAPAARGERGFEHLRGPRQPLVRPGAVRHGPARHGGHGGFRHADPRAQETRTPGPGLREGHRRAAPGGEDRAGGLLGHPLPAVQRRPGLVHHEPGDDRPEVRHGVPGLREQPLLRVEPQEVQRAVDRASGHAQRDADREPRAAGPGNRGLRVPAHRPSRWATTTPC